MILDVIVWLVVYAVLVLGFARAAYCSSERYRDEAALGVQGERLGQFKRGRVSREKGQRGC